MNTCQHKEYLEMELLRFTTAGSVDDGKSTLIGRLLYDCKAIFADQMEAIEQASIRRGEEQVNLALLTDGLRAEREQGITIDVAYRYFATPKRKFIIADTPGHIQYTRNMVTGASTANAALILIDARNSMVEQTIRHTFIASLLDISYIIVCVNKMDMVNYNQAIFENIKSDFEKVRKKLEINEVEFIPISALKGDNVVDMSSNMSWYKGNSLLHYLENAPLNNNLSMADPRFPVQYIIRPNSDEFHDYRGYAGRIEGGAFHQGDEVTILPSMLTSRIKSIDTFSCTLAGAFSTNSVTITLEDDIDISRGNMIVHKDNIPLTGQVIDMMICWFNEKPMTEGGKYLIQHTSNNTRCVIKEVDYKVNINTIENDYSDKIIKMNDIARIKIRTSKPLFYDNYKKNHVTGSLILIDEGTNETIGAGMIVK